MEISHSTLIVHLAFSSSEKFSSVASAFALELNFAIITDKYNGTDQSVSLCFTSCISLLLLTECSIHLVFIAHERWAITMSKVSEFSTSLCDLMSVVFCLNVRICDNWMSWGNLSFWPRKLHTVCISFQSTGYSPHNTLSNAFEVDCVARCVASGKFIAVFCFSTSAKPEKCESSYLQKAELGFCSCFEYDDSDIFWNKSLKNFSCSENVAQWMNHGDMRSIEVIRRYSSAFIVFIAASWKPIIEIALLIQ